MELNCDQYFRSVFVNKSASKVFPDRKFTHIKFRATKGITIRYSWLQNIVEIGMQRQFKQ